MKKLIFTFLTVLSLLIPACSGDEEGGVSFNFGQPTPTRAGTPTPLPTPIQVFQSTIAADGQVVLPLPPQTFTFQVSGLTGTIEEVYVVPGQRVKKGELMARIDDTDLRNALTRAEASLASLQAQITSEEAPALPGDIAEAEAALVAAQADLKRLLSLPSDEAITQAAADLRLREIELRQAQEAYDAIAYSEGLGMSPQAAQLQQATINYERSNAAYTEATKPATDAQIASARLQVVQAQNRLDKLQDETRPEIKAANEARIREAELQVEEARANLIKAQLFAPWDGEVTALNASPGMSTSSASVTLAQTEPLRFATSNFSERNLGDIQEGDQADIYLKAYPNTPFPAVIYRIELESNAKDGDTALFAVYFDFNSGEFEVRPGMTGRVEVSIEPEEIPR
jgi:HlyD family secretion protein